MGAREINSTQDVSVVKWHQGLQDAVFFAVIKKQHGFKSHAVSLG
jgi:hypothetical protein